MRFAGDMADPRIPDRNRKHMAEAEDLTRENDELNLVFAFNYGSRREITEAARAVARRVSAGDLEADDIDESVLAEAMYLPDMPDLDLIIRSSGEHRLSNFLLWQAAYAEFYFPGILWPDFNRYSLFDAIIDFQSRERRFGGADDHPEAQID